MKKSSFIIDIIATFFYSGFFPLGPGTFASILTTLILFFLPTLSFIFSISSILILTIIGLFVSDVYAKTNGQHDPSQVVIDEVVGMWISLLLVPKSIITFLIAFLLFRFFDIVKPYPINKFEKLPGGWGIMLDDILAGLFSFLFVHIFIYFLS
ncbi:phosphatidylglycerophosphatase A [Candidatus Dependentiae bacterium]|nr:phosphatidylglycerophosphatase A [Candidatus Dependentiae bacterium]